MIPKVGPSGSGNGPAGWRQQSAPSGGRRPDPVGSFGSPAAAPTPCSMTGTRSDSLKGREVPMKRCFACSVFVALAVLGIASFAFPAAAPVNWKGTVDGRTRTALVYPGTDALHSPSPLILFIHPGTFGPEQVSDWTQFQL